jgi:hypothetical protein
LWPLSQTNGGATLYAVSERIVNRFGQAALAAALPVVPGAGSAMAVGVRDSLSHVPVNVPTLLVRTLCAGDELAAPLLNADAVTAQALKCLYRHPN